MSKDLSVKNSKFAHCLFRHHEMTNPQVPSFLAAIVSDT